MSDHFQNYSDIELINYATDILDRAWESQNTHDQSANSLESIAASLIVIARNSLPINVHAGVEPLPGVAGKEK